MHLLIPFANVSSESGSPAWRELQLPNLARLMSRLTSVRRDAADESTLSPPHERAIAAELGLRAADGCLPWAAFHAAADGVDPGDAPWGELTPVHAHVGSDQITLLEPGALQLTDAESKRFFEAVRDLFESAGWRLVWGGATRWYVSHPSLAGLPTASLDRVIGRSIEDWTPAGATARAARALLNEVQMLLYPLALNDEREARGALTLNSLWLSGCGTRQPANARPDLTVAEHLRSAALAQDEMAWGEAWHALDAGEVASHLKACEAGDAVTLTLCGERSAERFESSPQSLWQRLGRRLQPFNPIPVLERL